MGEGAGGGPFFVLLKVLRVMPIRTQGSGSGTDGNHLLAIGSREGAASDSSPFSFLDVLLDRAFLPA